MIVAEELKKVLEERLAETDHFLVDLKVNVGNKILVEIDGDEGLPIADIISYSRFLEHDVLDREEEDFSLEVASPGLDKPFKVWRQYKKNVGRDLKVRLEQKSIEGTLTTVEEDHILLESKAKERVEGRKKKEWVVTEHKLPFDEIIESKIVISFK